MSKSPSSTKTKPSRHPRLTIVNHPLVLTRLTALRDIRTSPAEFRRSLRELTKLMLYEFTHGFDLTPCEVETPLAMHTGCQLSRPVVVVPILRAALGMAEAVLDIIPEAAVGHIGMARDEVTHRPQSYYSKHPVELTTAHAILVDPMLATGHSAAAALDELKAEGATDITFVCVLTCPEGLGHLAEAHPDVPVFTAVVDQGLNENAYIVPGLGDAGDRYFGTC